VANPVTAAASCRDRAHQVGADHDGNQEERAGGCPLIKPPERHLKAYGWDGEAERQV